MTEAYSGTLDRCYWPLMKGPSVSKGHCVVCGSNGGGHLEQHHVVFRSRGELYDAHGRKLKKPTLTLCGFGNTAGCHGLAHSGRLHFRYVETVLISRGLDGFRTAKDTYGMTHGGHWEFALFDEPCGYLEALDAGEWRPIC